MVRISVLGIARSIRRAEVVRARGVTFTFITSRTSTVHAIFEVPSALPLLLH